MFNEKKWNVFKFMNGAKNMKEIWYLSFRIDLFFRYKKLDGSKNKGWDIVMDILPNRTIQHPFALVCTLQWSTIPTHFRPAYLSTLLIWAVLFWFQTPKMLSTDWSPDLKKSTDKLLILLTLKNPPSFSQQVAQPAPFYPVYLTWVTWPIYCL